MIVEDGKKVVMAVSLKMNFGHELGPGTRVEVGNGGFGPGL